MPDKKLEGVVLSRLEYGESTLIIDFYSRESGRCSIGASLSKKKNNRFFYSPLNLLRLSVFTSKKSKYLRVKEVSSLVPEQLINRDSEIHAIRYFLAEFLKMTLNEEDADPALYLFIEEEIQKLYQSNQKAVYLTSFLENLTPFLGIDLEELRQNKSLVNEFGFSFSQNEWDQLLDPNPRDKRAHLNALLNFYAHQFDGVNRMKTREVLASVFN